MSGPEVTGKRFWEVWVEEAEREAEARGQAIGQAIGEAIGEAKSLESQIDAIAEFFRLKGLDWQTYEQDIRSFRSAAKAARFLVDLATAGDMGEFLRQTFGH